MILSSKLQVVKLWYSTLICISLPIKPWSIGCLIHLILFHILLALWFNLRFIVFSFAFLWSSSRVNLSGYEMSLYACLSALFWILCNIINLLLDSTWVGTGEYSMIGSTNSLYRCTLVLAFAAGSFQFGYLQADSSSLVFYAS